ncbi:MAG: hypothetical protein WC295_02420 [Methanoregula sp.]|jgi:hypothetical protein
MIAGFVFNSNVLARHKIRSLLLILRSITASFALFTVDRSSGNDGHLEREFIVASRAVIPAITVTYECVTDISVDATGASRIATGTGEVLV